MSLNTILQNPIRRSSNIHITSELNSDVFSPINLKKIITDPQFILLVQSELTQLVLKSFDEFSFNEFKKKYGDAINSVDDLTQASESNLEDLKKLKTKLFAYLYSIIGLTNELVLLLVKKPGDKLKIKTWDHATINSLLFQLSLYKFDAKGFDAITYQLNDILPTFDFLSYTQEDLQKARTEFDFSLIKTDLVSFVPVLIAHLNKILVTHSFVSTLNPTMINAISLYETMLSSPIFSVMSQNIDYGVDMDTLRKKMIQKSKVDALNYTCLDLFDEITFDFIKFMPVGVIQSVKKRIDQVLITPVNPNESEVEPYVEPISKLTEFYYIFEQLQILSENVPHFYPLFSISYFEVLPSKEEVFSDFKFLQSISNGKMPFVSNTEVTECPNELEGLSETEVKDKIISISKELKKHYKEFTSHYF